MPGCRRKQTFAGNGQAKVDGTNFFLNQISAIKQRKFKKNNTPSYNTPGIPTTIETMRVNITTIVYLRVFNHPNWVNHYFNGGGSPGIQEYENPTEAQTPNQG